MLVQGATSGIMCSLWGSRDQTKGEPENKGTKERRKEEEEEEGRKEPGMQGFVVDQGLEELLQVQVLVTCVFLVFGYGQQAAKLTNSHQRYQQ